MSETSIIQHAGSDLHHVGEIDHEAYIEIVAGVIRAAPVGTVFVLSQHRGSDAGAIRASVPYASGEARSFAEAALERGRQAVTAAHRIVATGPENTPLDDLLFNVGAAREILQRALTAAHAAIPDALAPRKDTTLDDPVLALAARIGRALQKCGGGDA